VDAVGPSRASESFITSRSATPSGAVGELLESQPLDHRRRGLFDLAAGLDEGDKVGPLNGRLELRSAGQRGSCRAGFSAVCGSAGALPLRFLDGL
jgi:hypothetical protein